MIWNALEDDFYFFLSSPFVTLYSVFVTFWLCYLSLLFILFVIFMFDHILLSYPWVGLQYDHQRGSIRGFSWKRGITQYPGLGPDLITSRPNESLFVPIGSWRFSLQAWTRNHPPCWATLLRPRLFQRHPWWCRNINLLAIAYASRPRLRYRLTHGRIILPQETLGLRRPGFSPGLSLLMPA